MARYGEAFKAAAVDRIAAPSGEDVEDVSRELGVKAETLLRWVEDAGRSVHGVSPAEQTAYLPDPPPPPGEPPPHVRVPIEAPAPVEAPPAAPVATTPPDKIKWMRPSGVPITTNGAPAAIEYAESHGWTRV